MGASNKLAVITGAASGIGSGLASEALRRGYRLLLADRNEAELMKTAAALGDAETLVVDVTNDADLEALADRADALGGTDLLFNNAGIMTTGFSWEIPAADWQRAISVNILGVVNGLRHFVPRMLARATPARIINTASVGGFLPSPLMAPYSVTKFGVVALTESLKFEMDLLGAPIGVSLLAPGPVHSAIFHDPFGGEARPETKAFVSQMSAMLSENGMAPEAFAALVFDAIDRGDYWIVPQGEALDPGLDRRNQSIAARETPVLNLG